MLILKWLISNPSHTRLHCELLGCQFDLPRSQTITKVSRNSKKKQIIRHLSWYFILPQADRRADAVIATTVWSSKNGRNHFHLTRFCCSFCCGGGSDPHLVVMTISPTPNWSGKSRARRSGKDRNVANPGRGKGLEPRWISALILSSLSVFSRAPLPSLIRTGLIWPCCSFPDCLCSLCTQAVDSLKVTDLLITSAKGGYATGQPAVCLWPPFVCLCDCCSKYEQTFITFPWNIDNGPRKTWLHFGDFPDSTGTFDLWKIKVKLSECSSSLSLK